MTFDHDIIADRLKKLEEVAGNLALLRSESRERFVGDFRLFWTAERGLQLGAESVLDLAAHILASTFDCYPETNEGMLDELLARGVLSSELRARLRGLGGLRNLVVHRYLDIDEGRVYEHIQTCPEDLRAFVGEVVEWLGRRGSAPGPD